MKTLLHRIFFCMLLSGWVTTGILPFNRPTVTMDTPISYCETNPLKDVGETI